jgi:hypothetical protein
VRPGRDPRPVATVLLFRAGVTTAAGQALLPTLTLANEQFTWVAGGKTNGCCCVPCDEETPESIQPPDADRKKYRPSGNAQCSTNDQ